MAVARLTLFLWVLFRDCKKRNFYRWLDPFADPIVGHDG